MLNELYSLSDTMNDMSIEADSWHQKYKCVPKFTIRLWIADDSTVSDFEEMDPALISVLRKYGDNNNAFPAFNIPPMFRITNEQQIKKLKNISQKPSELDIDEIRSWCIHDNWHDSRRQTINKCLHRISHELLIIVQKYNLEETRPIDELIRLISKFPHDDVSLFKSSIETCIFKNLHAQSNIELSLKLLFHVGNVKKNPKEDCGAIPIILDICEWRKYKYPIAHENTTKGINKALQMEDASTNSTILSENDVFDAFGCRYNNIGKNEPMPTVTIPGLALVTLRSMFHDHKCQYRYGMIDDISYPIADENRARVKQALEWIANSKREGKTWVKTDGKELVFAYMSKMPELLDAVAIFAPPNDLVSKDIVKRFEDVTADFIKTLKGISSESELGNIQVFSIRKMDKARSKVIYSKNCTPQSLIDSAVEWQNGCANIPLISCLEQYTPYPLEIADAVNTVWRQDGGSNVVKKMKYYHGMELLLEHLSESTVRHYLMLTHTNSFGLITYFGNREHRKENCSDRCKKSVGSIVSILGLLLYKSRQKKEDYMEDTAYLLGQLLKVSDELHVLYSRIERKGSIPPQLAGNAMLIAMSESPWRTIALHGQRMLPYIAWAKRYRFRTDEKEKKDVRIAGWYLRLYEQFGAKLNNALNNDVRFDEFEKAKLFIGYLAAFPVKEKGDVTASADDGENINVKGEEV